jgi:ADP-ribose pyrophosphatase YjhB (NUDIX family)
MASKHIPEELYSKIHAEMPIACIDLMVVNGNRVLLLERLREPDKGKYWCPGGRIQKGENFETSAYRILYEETRMKIAKLEFMGPSNCVFQKDPFGHGKRTHTVSFVFACKPENYEGIHLDEDHRSFHWWRPGEMTEIPVAEGVKRLAWDTVYNLNLMRTL